MIGLLALLPVFLTGILSHILLYPGIKGRQRIEELPVTFGFGSGLLYLLFLWTSLLGATGLVWSYLPAAGLTLGVFCRRRRMGAGKATIPMPERWHPAEILLLVVLCGVLLGSIGLTLALPVFDLDTRILWALKTKILTSEKTLTGDVFRDPYRLHIHPRYPLLLPWLGSFIARHQGEFREIDYQALVGLIGILAVWQFYRLARCAGTRMEALLFCLVLACSGIWLRTVFGAGVELALIFYLLLVLGALFRWLEERNLLDLLAAGFFLFCLAMTKNEGFLLALCVIAGLALTLLFKGEFAAIPSAVGWPATVFFLAAAVWFWHLAQIPAVSDENYLQRLRPGYLMQGISRLGAIVTAILREAADVRQWHLIWLLPLLLPALATKKGKVRAPEFVLPFFLVVSYSLGILLIYILSPWRNIGMHIDVTFDRVMLPLLPVILLLAVRVSAGEVVYPERK